MACPRTVGHGTDCQGKRRAWILLARLGEAAAWEKEQGVSVKGLIWVKKKGDGIARGKGEGTGQLGGRGVRKCMSSCRARTWGRGDG